MTKLIARSSGFSAPGVPAFLLALVGAFLASCGGGGGGGGGGTAPTPPTISTQPQNITVNDGQTASFSVTASGTAPLTYEWRKDGVAIGGATSSAYTTPALQLSDSGAEFSVLVTNAGGSITSSAATLTVNPGAPVITAQPANSTVSAGQSALFSVAASGSGPLAYQWKRGGVNVPGANTATYSISVTTLSDNGASFSVSVSNGGGSVTSTSAILVVNPIAPSITAQPQAQSVADGSTATFSVGAAGTAPLTFQWNRNGTTIPGATAAIYTTPIVHVADSGALYSVAVSNPSSVVAVSGTAALTVTPVAPSITTQPQPQSVPDGSTATFSVIATGTGPLVYQWRKGGINIPGATAATYTTPAVALADSGTSFDVVVSNQATPPATSAAATLTVTAAAPSITTQPQSQTVVSGSAVTFSVTAAGSAPFTYQWKKNGTDISGATAATYQIASATAADPGSYTVVVTNSVAPAATSNAAILFVTHTLSLIAGELGGAGHSDGNGAAATFYTPTGIATDSSGNIYVSDLFNQLIRMVTPAGVVSTIAGTPGVAGSTNGAGSTAKFRNPQQLAVDASGNIYVADSGNHVIRMITSAGTVSTLAGSAGSSGSVDGTGASARFRSPSGIAVYQPAIPGPVTLIVADTGNHTIRQIDSSGAVTTLAGTAGSSGSTDDTGAAARFFAPQGLSVDQITGTIYIADTSNSTVRQIAAGGVVTTLAGTAGSGGHADGTGAAATFIFPSSVTIDSTGANLYVADRGNLTIRQITIPGAVVTTFAGTAGAQGSSDGTGAAAQFSTPNGVAIDSSGNLYVADNINNLVRQITTPGAVVTTFAGNTGGRGFTDGTGGGARFNNPHFVAVDSAGNLYVADHLNDAIRKITPAGVVTTINGPFDGPYGVAADSLGNVYVADTNNNVIRKISPAGTVSLFAGGSAGFVDGTGAAAKFRNPVAVATDVSDNVYVGDFDNNAIRMITPGGVVTTIAGSTAGAAGSTDGTGTAARFNGPRGLAVDQATGNIYVTDRDNGTVRLITMPGAAVTTYAGTAGAIGFADGTGAAAKFNWPNGPGLDAAGNLYVTDSNNHAIRKIAPNRVVTTIVGAAPTSPLSYSVNLGDLPGSLNGPSSLAVIPGTPVQLVITEATENAVLKAILP